MAGLGKVSDGLEKMLDGLRKVSESDGLRKVLGGLAKARVFKKHLGVINIVVIV